MVDIKLLIEVNPNESAEKIDSVQNNNAELSNVSVKTSSQQNFIDIPAQESSPNGLVWAYKYENSDDNYLVFNSEDYVDNVENSNGYLQDESNSTQLVWGIVPENKEFNVRLTINGTTALKDVVIYGDKENNQFATQAIIDDTETIYSDDATWSITFPNENDIHTIEFTHWNRANYNAVISGIAVMSQYIELNNAFIKEFNSLSEIQDGDNISYDIIPSVADFTIIDRDGEIKDAINQKIITDSNLPIKLFINGKQIRNHISTTSRYDVFGNLFKVSASDLLETIFEKEVQSIVEPTETSLFILVYSVLSKFGYSYVDVVNAFQHSMFYNGNTTYGTIKSFMEKIVVQYPAFQKIKLRDFLSQLCQVLNIGGRLNSNGKLEFFSLRPKTPSRSKIVAIPLKHQFSNPSPNMFPLDVYKKVLISGSTTEQTTNSENYNSMELFKVSDGTYYKKVDTEYLFGDSYSEKEYQTSSSNIFMDETNIVQVEDPYYPLIQEFAENILDDYSEGSDIVTLKVSFSDYFDINGHKVIDSQIGEFVDVGTIVRIDKNNSGDSRFINLDGTPKYWTVVSSEIVKNGVPFVQLALRSVKQINTSNKVETPYFTTKPSLTTNVEYTINCPTEGASIVQYTDDTYSQIEYVYKDGDVFFTKGLSVVNITAYFKAKKDGMQDSEPFVFQYGNSSGDSDIIKPL